MGVPQENNSKQKGKDVVVLEDNVYHHQTVGSGEKRGAC